MNRVKAILLGSAGAAAMAYAAQEALTPEYSPVVGNAESGSNLYNATTYA